MPGAAPQQGQEDGSTGILWAIAGLFTIFGIIWYNFKDQIISGYFTLKVWELNVLSLFTESQTIAQLKTLALQAQASPAAMDFDNMLAIGKLVGVYLRIPFAAILIALAVIVYFGNSTRTFKTTYSMKILAQSEKGNWPQISPVLSLDLVKTDIDTGPWAMAMTPVQFCRKNNLLEEFRRPRTEGTLRRDADRVEAMLKRGEANKIFALQLGPKWEGYHRLPPYAKALFAIFAARINADSKAAANLLLQLNRSSTAKNLDFRGVDELYKKHENTKLVQKIMQSHAYVLTVMSSMLTNARLDGVQATADFLWLKPLDRRLWYVLNTMGRQTPFVESAGPYAHWVAEKEAGRKLIIPMVETATNALDQALKSMVYHPEEK
jgi:intracellular multiplication protein IcmP